MDKQPTAHSAREVAGNDRELVAAMLRGDQHAFRTFFDTCFPRVYRFALARLRGDVASAEEVAQTTLIKAVRKLASFRYESALSSWLCQICRREILDLIRYQQRFAMHIAPLESDAEARAIVERIPAPAADQPSDACDADELRTHVRSVLADLPRAYRDVLAWKYIEGRSVEEIGLLLGRGTVATQSMLARARNALRAALEPAPI